VQKEISHRDRRHCQAENDRRIKHYLSHDVHNEGYSNNLSSVTLVLSKVL
jgi:hypothetical protein